MYAGTQLLILSENISLWYHCLNLVSLFGTILGATKPIYAPEPFDVGRLLQVDIVFDDQRSALTTTGPIDPGLIRFLYFFPSM